MEIEEREADGEQVHGGNSIEEGIISCIEHDITKLPAHDYVNENNCIFRVPDSIRKVYPESFTPRVIAIGPFHHGNPNLKRMEDRKLRYFHELISNRTKYFNINRNELITITRYITGKEKAIRDNYQYPIDFCSADFTRMILLDSIFIILLLLEKEFENQMLEQWFVDLLNDILLIENQIPLFVPSFIYDKYKGLGFKKKNFFDLVCSFFQDVMYDANEGLPLGKSFTFKESTTPRNFTDFLWRIHIPREYFLVRPRVTLINWRSDTVTASELLMYGIKLKVSGTRLLTEIKFKPEEGTLLIPQIKVNEWTETFFRNLVAMEQFWNKPHRLVTDYVIFLDSLIDTPMDVNILISACIIQGDHLDQERVFNLLKNLFKEAILHKNFYFAEQVIKLNHYRRDCRHELKARWYNWKSILKSDHFNSPWAIISLIAAVILLGLTIVQTVCSIYQAMGIKM